MRNYVGAGFLLMRKGNGQQSAFDSDEREINEAASAAAVAPYVQPSCHIELSSSNST